MTQVIINDEKFEAEEGETLMEVGRRNGAHLGFWCNGRGICTFCECRVEEGAELLNPVTGTEKARLSPERLESGSRMTCRAAVTGEEGTVKVITRAEKVKQQFLRVVNAPAFSLDNRDLRDLWASMARMSADYLSMYPYVFGGIARGKTGLGILNPFKDFNTWLQDGSRVISRELERDRAAGDKAPADTATEK